VVALKALALATWQGWLGKESEHGTEMGADKALLTL